MHRILSRQISGPWGKSLWSHAGLLGNLICIQHRLGEPYDGDPTTQKNSLDRPWVPMTSPSSLVTWGGSGLDQSAVWDNGQEAGPGLSGNTDKQDLSFCLNTGKVSAWLRPESAVSLPEAVERAPAFQGPRQKPEQLVGQASWAAASPGPRSRVLGVSTWLCPAGTGAAPHAARQTEETPPSPSPRSCDNCGVTWALGEGGHLTSYTNIGPMWCTPGPHITLYVN